MEYDPIFDAKAPKPWLIAGPCSAETEQQVIATASGLQNAGLSFFRAGVWKPRTRPGSFEGVGVKALPWLKRVRDEFGLRPIIEVATAHQVEEALEAGIDAFWLGARTTVNPFSVHEVAEALTGTDVVMLVKNPVNPDLALWIGAIERLEHVGLRKLGAVHRGFSQYGEQVYRNAPIWDIPIEMRRLMPNLPLLCDNSHICGRRDLLGIVAQSALNLTFDGLMTEVHVTPDEAWTDAKQQITPDVYIDLIASLVIRKSEPEDLEFTKYLQTLRTKIDKIDHHWVSLLAERMELARQIGQGKLAMDMAILQTTRYSEMLTQARLLAKEVGLNEAFVARLLSFVHTEAIEIQQQEMLHKLEANTLIGKV
jgi:chorismate mutase